LPSACCLVREEREEVAPPGVVHAFVATGLAAGPVVRIGAVLILLWRRTTAQVGGLNRLDRDHIILAHRRERGRVVEVESLPAHVLLLLGTLPYGLLASLAALLATCYLLLCFLQVFLRPAIVPWVLRYPASRRHQKHLQPHVYPGLLSRLRERLD